MKLWQWARNMAGGRRRTRRARALVKQWGAGSDDPDLWLLPGYDPFATAAGCRYDAVAAEKVVRFIETCLTHVKGAKGRQAFLLEPWQRGLVKNLFGWKRADGTRRYREAFVYIPRKNGKTALAAAILLAILLLDEEPGAEIYSAAADRDQAALVFEQVRGMIQQEPRFADLLKLYRTAVTWPKANRSYRVLSADAHTKHGFNAHVVLVDELHAQPNRELVDVLATSQGARRQPLMISITTADYDRPSICNEKYEQAKRVRDNPGDPAALGYDPAFLPVVYEAAPDDDWREPAVWRKANPNLGVSIDEDFLRRECLKAQESPAFENTFRRLYLNQRTRTDVLWLPLEKWKNEAPELSLELLAGRDCWCGLDLASTRDLTAFVMAFPLDDGVVALLPRFWIPAESVVARSRRDRVPYDVWVRQGWMIETEGNATDYQRVRADIEALAGEYNIREIAIDRLFQGEETAHRLMDAGFEVIAFGQGFYTMAAPTKRFDELFHARKLAHPRNPCLDWQIGNVAVETDDAGNLKPSRKKSTEKIDGVVASIMALGRLTQRPEVRSVYETRGMLVL